MDFEWYEENKFMLWSLNIIFPLMVLLETSLGNFLVAMWVAVAYIWFNNAMRSSEIAYRAIRVMDKILERDA